MTSTQLLLAVILIQQGWFGTLWLVAAWLRLARRAAFHWAAATLLVAAGMGLYLLRGDLPGWLTVPVANTVIAAAFAVMRRGVQLFARRPTTDVEQIVVLTLTAACLAVGHAGGYGLYAAVVVVSVALGWTMLRAAFEMQALAPEFGRMGARWCAVPMALIGLMFALRAVLVLALGTADGDTATALGVRNIGVMLASLVFGLVVNTTLISMTVIRLVSRLRHQSDHDVLTQLLNRRAMERLLTAQAQLQRRFGGGYAILSLDVDHFKHINDEYGHPAGDAVLVRLAETLRAACREVDRVARMGGEEFCVLLPGVDAAGAERAAQRLLDAVRHMGCPEVAHDLHVTVSIGMVVVDAGGTPAPTLMRHLDEALYAAKAHGRDRIERAQPVPA